MRVQHGNFCMGKIFHATMRFETGSRREPQHAFGGEFTDRRSFPAFAAAAPVAAKDEGARSQAVVAVVYRKIWILALYSLKTSGR
jgi:hypothetical protein